MKKKDREQVIGEKVKKREKKQRNKKKEDESCSNGP